MASVRSSLFACLALAVAAGGAIASEPAPAPAPSPILGEWDWSSKDGKCKEVHAYRADGTASTRSGDEVLEKTYTAEDYGGGFWIVRETVTASNGGRDCLGGTTEVGKQAGYFALPVNGGGYYTCSSNEGWGCYGTARERRQPPSSPSSSASSASANSGPLPSAP
jgi:hypothetical protein